MSGTVLDRIVADKRARLDRGEYSAPKSGAANSDGARFVASLREPGIRIVAEIKHRSPSAGEILPGADGKVETMALAYRRGHAAAISVVIEEDHFGGKPDWLPRAKRVSGLPVLMKDFIVSESQLDFAVSLSADAVLLIVRILGENELERLREAARQRGLAAVLEAHDEGQARRAAGLQPDVLAINARDLSNFETDLDSVAALGPRVPPGPVLLAESGIRDRSDIARLAAAGYQAFLVGETLLRSEDPEAALRELRS